MTMAIIIQPDLHTNEHFIYHIICLYVSIKTFLHYNNIAHMLSAFLSLSNACGLERDPSAGSSFSAGNCACLSWISKTNHATWVSSKGILCWQSQNSWLVIVVLFGRKQKSGEKKFYAKISCFVIFRIFMLYDVMCENHLMLYGKVGKLCFDLFYMYE